MWFGIPITLLILNYVDYSSTISCTSQLGELSCLPAFSHHPSSRPKCYCTSRCPSLDDLRNCPSGQLQHDPCGICLECAPGFGDKCGGLANKDGLCAAGFACLIRFNPAAGEIEHNKTGKCVDASNDQCEGVRRTVSCRPGQLGIPVDFPFCPSSPQSCTPSQSAQDQAAQDQLAQPQNGQGNRVSDQSTRRPGGSRTSSSPGFLFAALESKPIRNVVAAVNNVRDSPSSVRDTILNNVRDTPSSVRETILNNVKDTSVSQILDTVSGFLNK